MKYTQISWTFYCLYLANTNPRFAILLLLVYLSDVVPASQTHFDLHENCSEAYLLALLLLFWFH